MTMLHKTRPFEGQIALITGASRGLGAAFAEALASGGAHVILVARTVGGLEAVDDRIQQQDGQATLVPLDLKEGDKIDSLAASIYERWGRLDILIGNAGMLGSLTPVAHLDPKEWAEIFAVNVTANARLIRACDPLLRLSEHGRAVFITDKMAQEETPYWGAYSASKKALEQLVATYEKESENSKINVHLFAPEASTTRLRAKAYPTEEQEGLKLPSEAIEPCLNLLIH